jgi:vacuolar-type H+-ATPase subunit H
MASHRKTPDGDGGEAISRLLHAERDAEAAVALARVEADARVAAARAQAVAIAERTDRRIARIHAGSAEVTAKEISALRARARDTVARSERPLPAAAIEAAASHVADWLLGIEGEGA